MSTEISYDELLTWSTLVDAGSVAGAAKNLGVSIGTVRHRLQKLEEKHPYLTHKDKNGRVRPTPLGKELAATIGDAVRRVEQVKKEVLSVNTSVLQIAAPEDLLLVTNIIELLGESWRAFKQAILDISTYGSAAAYTKLIEGECNVAFCAKAHLDGSTLPKHIHRETFKTFPIRVYVSTDNFSEFETQLRDIRAQYEQTNDDKKAVSNVLQAIMDRYGRLLLSEPESSFRQFIEEQFGTCGIPMNQNQVSRFNTLGVKLLGVKHQIGALLTWEEDIVDSQKGVEAVDLSWALGEWQYDVVFDKTNLTTVGQHFINKLLPDRSNSE